MRFSNQQLILWYGTSDAPAPSEGGTGQRRGLSVTIGVQPSNPSNAVVVRYRIDRGLIQSVRAVRVRTDFARGVEYHRATFPDFWTGERVEYVPILTCAGRTAPDPLTAMSFPSSFGLEGGSMSNERVKTDSQRDVVATPRKTAVERLPVTLDYLASLHIPLQPPETIAVTPDGIVVNWLWAPGEAAVNGPEIRARIRQVGGDSMIIRRDGVGVMDVRATLETDDGALVFVSSVGHGDLGESGYHDVLARRWPARVPTRTAPRFQTAHSRYLWLNRLHCVGIGELRMTELMHHHDLYVVR